MEKPSWADPFLSNPFLEKTLGEFLRLNYPQMEKLPELYSNGEAMVKIQPGFLKKQAGFSKKQAEIFEIQAGILRKSPRVLKTELGEL